MKPPTSIVVRAPNWVGDVVMSTPGLRALREAHPDAHIAVQLRDGLEPLLRGSPWADELLPVPALGGARGVWRAASDLKRARRGGFDLGICIPDSFSSAIVMRLAGVGRVVGFRRSGRGPLLHHAVSPPAEWGRRRLVARERFVLELMRAVGGRAKATHLELFTTADEEAQVDRVLAGEASRASIAVLAPGASFGPSKCWPAASFAAVGDAAARSGARVIVLGSPAEGLLVGRVTEAMSEPALGLAGALDLGGVKALLRRASLLVCNDAGARHVAVAFGVPALVMMGPTSLAKTDCNLEDVRVYTAADVDCSPCYRRECPIDHRCMTRISPERVLADALPILERSTSRA